MSSLFNITDDDISVLENELTHILGKDISFDAQRRKAIKGNDDVQACPGSGKTFMVASKLILLAKKWNRAYKGVCALTHTNVAKDEILKLLTKHPVGHKLLTYPHFIGTIQEFIDKYPQSEFIREAKIGLRN